MRPLFLRENFLILLDPVAFSSHPNHIFFSFFLFFFLNLFLSLLFFRYINTRNRLRESLIIILLYSL